MKIVTPKDVAMMTPTMILFFEAIDKKEFKLAAELVESVKKFLDERGMTYKAFKDTVQQISKVEIPKDDLFWDALSKRMPE